MSPNLSCRSALGTRNFGDHDLTLNVKIRGMAWFKNNWQYVGAGISVILSVGRASLDAADVFSKAGFLQSEWGNVIGLVFFFLFGAAILY